MNNQYLTVARPHGKSIVWQLGVATNQEIGEKFGLTYSAVSQRVRLIKVLLNKDKEIERKYKHIKSQIKI